MASRAITIDSRDGLELEAELDEPSSTGGVAVLCHPHPQMGGTMNAPLLLALRDRLVGEGWAVLRFNFRGIGSSQGKTGTGEAEVMDALGAFDDATARFPSLPLVTAGWSFGAAVAIHAAQEDDRPMALALIAPAVAPRPGVTRGTPAPVDVTSTAPVLVICGANDELVEPAACRSWTDSLPNATYIEVKGANHFFWAKYEELADMVARFFADVVTGSR